MKTRPSHLFLPPRVCYGSLPSTSSAPRLAPPDASADPAAPPVENIDQNDSICQTVAVGSSFYFRNSATVKFKLLYMTKKDNIRGEEKLQFRLELTTFQ